MTPRSWSRVALVVPAHLADDIAAHCFELGSCGVHAEEAGETTRLNVYFDGDDADGARQRLRAGLEAAGMWPDQGAVVDAGVEAERDWNAAWKAFYQPVWATPRIVVHPPWIPVDTEPGQLAIRIDPAMAFGTGGHESTQLALLAIEDTPLEGAACLDVGAGSGVLSIALLRLGAGRVTAVDVDPVTIDNANLNLEANLGADASRAEVHVGSVEVVAGRCFDLIVANIERHLVRPALPGIVAALAPQGAAIFSGLVEREQESFTDELAAAGLRVERTWHRNEWFSCRARPAGD